MDASNFGNSTGIFILYTLDTCRTSLGRSPADQSFGAVHPQMIPLPAADRIEGMSRLEISGSHVDATSSHARGMNRTDAGTSQRISLESIESEG